MTGRATGAVVVLGSANADLVVRAPRLAGPGETLSATSATTGAGGKGLNQAVAAARAGARVAFAGAVGEDPHGQLLRGVLQRDGVDTALLRTDGARATGLAVVTVTDDGENSILVVPGANALDDLTDDDRRAVAAASHLVLQLERPRELVRRALRVAREHGTTTVLTPAPVSDGLDELVALTDLLVLNAGEAEELSGEPGVERAAEALSRSATTVVVTLGADGALVATGGAVVRRVPARPAAAVDTTGAGDTFAGVLVALLAEGARLERALAAATTAASLSVERPGAAASMPTRAEITAALPDLPDPTRLQEATP
ncbi:ribokinase [Quadrisphaera setariae]|uniref:Ribokinase n=1 Tax=Quadrisphaera setariae TaxID=2593304 RepID=A0A5C8ZIW3_9ACTN|nr:ribokinase [Quadrisphaera setariae]TXR58005.1 ribokinase [Quadrisphaera setariae]